LLFKSLLTEMFALISWWLVCSTLGEQTC